MQGCSCAAAAASLASVLQAASLRLQNCPKNRAFVAQGQCQAASGHDLIDNKAACQKKLICTPPRSSLGAQVRQ